MAYGTVKIKEIIAKLVGQDLAVADVTAEDVTVDSVTTDLLVAVTTAPAAADSTGTAGTIFAVDGFIYACIATDTWQRVAIATWA